MRNFKIVDVYEIAGVDEDGETIGEARTFMLSRPDAIAYAKMKYQSNWDVAHRNGLLTDDGELFIVRNTVPFKLSDKKELNEVRIRALAKLTTEEKAALGL